MLVGLVSSMCYILLDDHGLRWTSSHECSDVDAPKQSCIIFYQVTLEKKKKKKLQMWIDLLGYIGTTSNEGNANANTNHDCPSVYLSIHQSIQSIHPINQSIKYQIRFQKSSKSFSPLFFLSGPAWLFPSPAKGRPAARAGKTPPLQIFC